MTKGAGLGGFVRKRRIAISGAVLVAIGVVLFFVLQGGNGNAAGYVESYMTNAVGTQEICVEDDSTDYECQDSDGDGQVDPNGNSYSVTLNPNGSVGNYSQEASGSLNGRVPTFGGNSGNTGSGNTGSSNSGSSNTGSSNSSSGNTGSSNTGTSNTGSSNTGSSAGGSSAGGSSAGGSATTSDVGPSPCGFLPATSKMRGINYLQGVGVSCATVRQVAIDAANASYHPPCFQNAAETCTVDGYTCQQSVVNNGLDSKDVCVNAAGDKVITNTAGSPA